MLTLDQIIEALQDRNLTRVSERTGISASYLSLLRSGKRTEPGYSTVKTLSDYLEGKLETA